MNQEQVMSLIRSVLMIAGTLLSGSGYMSNADWATLSGAILTVAPLVWGVVDKTKANMVAKVNAMPEVKGVITQDTIEGRQLAAAVPSNCVTPAGTPAAASVAETTHGHAR